MKKVSILLTALALCFALIAGSSSVANAATTTIDPNQNLSGVWTSPENPSWNIVFSQDKNDIVVTCNFYGGANSDIPVVWHGVGKAKAGKVTFTSIFTVCPAGWERTAKIELDVRENMNVLVGTSTDSKGAKTDLKFVRKIISKAQALPTPAAPAVPIIK